MKLHIFFDEEEKENNKTISYHTILNNNIYIYKQSELIKKINI